MPRRLRIAILIVVISVAGVWAFSGDFSPWLERSAQPVSFGSLSLGYAFDVPPSYNNFADQRTLFGVPNFMDVASNLPFLLVGIWGLAVLARRQAQFEFAGELHNSWIARCGDSAEVRRVPTGTRRAEIDVIEDVEYFPSKL